MSTQTVRPPSDTAKRRSQAIAGALAGLAIVLVLVAVFVIVKANKSDEPAAAAPVPAAAPSSDPAADPSAAAVPPSAAAQQPAAVQTPAGLEKAPVVKGGGTAKLTKTVVTPLIKGTGAVVKAGQTITVNYVLVKYADGTPIESSWESQPFSTPIGTGKLIKGWDQTIPGQKVGSRLQLDIPAADAYGPDPGDLRFVVDILAAK